MYPSGGGSCSPATDLCLGGGPTNPLCKHPPGDPTSRQGVAPYLYTSLPMIASTFLRDPSPGDDSTHEVSQANGSFLGFRKRDDRLLGSTPLLLWIRIKPGSGERAFMRGACAPLTWNEVSSRGRHTVRSLAGDASHCARAMATHSPVKDLAVCSGSGRPSRRRHASFGSVWPPERAPKIQRR